MAAAKAIAHAPGLPLAPGETIGILGGGQLGRMLAGRGAELGFDCHVFDPDPDAPAARVAARSVAASFQNHAAVEAFAARCAVVTCEFENVPLGTLRAAGNAARLAPTPASFAAAADRLEERKLLTALTIPVAAFAPAFSAEEAAAALNRLGAPAIMKVARGGYDGIGQVRVTTRDEAEAAFLKLGAEAVLIEERVAFRREVSLVLARFPDGAVAFYPPAENRHSQGVLRETIAPADMTRAQLEALQRWGARLAEHLGHVGVMAVECFETETGELLVNEIAPRVHNSGHWTQIGCGTDQFEQHIRAIAGWPPGDMALRQAVRMQNLLGDDVHDWPKLGERSGAKLVIYGKRQARAGRKMGHVLEPLRR